MDGDILSSFPTIRPMNGSVDLKQRSNTAEKLIRLAFQTELGWC